MVVGSQRGGSYPGKQRAECRLPRQIDAQHQGVDEETDQVLEIDVIAAGDGGSHGEVGLAAGAGQQHRIGGQEGHLEGDVVRLSQLPQRGDQFARERKGVLGAPVAESCWPRSIGGQLQGGQIGQLAPPVVEQRRRSSASWPTTFVLPHGIVGILDG